MALKKITQVLLCFDCESLYNFGDVLQDDNYKGINIFDMTCPSCSSKKLVWATPPSITGAYTDQTVLDDVKAHLDEAFDMILDGIEDAGGKYDASRSSISERYIRPEEWKNSPLKRDTNDEDELYD